MWKVALVFLLACGSAQPVVIKSPQDFDNSVEDLIKEVIDAFKNDGINCELINSDLNTIDASQKMKVTKQWLKDHKDAQEDAAKRIQAHQAEFIQAAAPTMRQCGKDMSGTLQSLLQ